ncbi:TIGR02647 family protein [Methylomonas sp. AM2-LC]|uniref:TIGR02647 family protein n=1 Tax=Methylomonas sp. AM2-LC TaxID=3153301 RepID=UPI0032666387
MLLSDEIVAEIKFLSLFNLASHQEGVKVHGNADPQMISAAKRLFDKGFVTQEDGGYLSDLGVEVAEYAQKMLIILNS